MNRPKNYWKNSTWFLSLKNPGCILKLLLFIYLYHCSFCMHIIVFCFILLIEYHSIDTLTRFLHKNSTTIGGVLFRFSSAGEVVQAFWLVFASQTVVAVATLRRLYMKVTLFTLLLTVSRMFKCEKSRKSSLHIFQLIGLN